MTRPLLPLAAVGGKVVVAVTVATLVTGLTGRPLIT